MWSIGSGPAPTRPARPATFSHLFALLAAGAITPVVTELSLDHARRAHELLEAGEIRGQLVLVT